ncbi:unnamed protein product [Ophioblennius macclurei]
MNSNHEEDEFVAVRVQDPRIQSEGSWNSYVDYKIFLHTNSKAFTAKTSCVRRRYSEFVWLRKKMQKNAGLVPVPDLPGKSFFSFSNEDFLERRRKGLQLFLEKVVQTTVCLSDSQLHLFLQTQLPIGHILDCVQGHTPYTVTDAILTYASSNRGLAQAQEDDSVKDSSLTVSYESMESPALHAPFPQNNEAFSPELLSCADNDDVDPLDGLLELAVPDSAPSQQEAELSSSSSVRISQKSDRLEAVVVVEGCCRFYLGGSPDEAQRIQTPALVHSPVGGGFQQSVDSVFESDEVAPEGSPLPENVEDVKPEKFDGSIEILVLKDDGEEEQTTTTTMEDDDPMAPEEEPSSGDVCLERLVLENPGGTRDEETLQSDVTHSEGSGEDSQSLPSSNGSIVKVTDEEEEEVEEDEEEEDADLSIPDANGLVKMSPHVLHHWSEAELSGGDGVLDMQVNGCAADKSELALAVGDGDLTENSDISILESSSAPGPGLGDGKRADDDDTQEAELL